MEITEQANWTYDSVSVVVLGAGFSVAATDGRMPLMNNFFDCLDPAIEPHLFECVSCVANDYKTANIERVLIALEQIRTSPDDMLKGWADKLKVNLPVLRRELSMYMLRRLKQGLDVSDDNWAANWLVNFGPTTTVISMNYDNIAERILSWAAHSVAGWRCPHCKMRELLQKACSCGPRIKDFQEHDWRGTLIKPHGSIAWKRCVNQQCCNYECLVADEHCRPFEPCRCRFCGQECEPVLVMPTMSKSLHEMPEIGAMWNAARLAVTAAESIVFFGFSMPSSDGLLVQLFRSAIAAGRRLRRVAAIDLDPKSVLARFSDCVPRSYDVTYSRFDVIPGECPNWFVKCDGDPRDRTWHVSRDA